MADKKTNFFGQVKTQITAGVGVVLATLGTVFSDKVEEFFGVEDDDAAVEVTQEQNVNVEGPTINITIPEQKKDTVVKKYILNLNLSLLKQKNVKKKELTGNNIYNK